LTNDVADAGEKLSLAQLEELISTDPERATEELRRLLRGDPLNAGGYRLLARALRRTQEDSAQEGLIRTTVRAADQLLMRAGQALEADDLETAEIILRRRLVEQPDEPPDSSTRDHQGRPFLLRYMGEFIIVYRRNSDGSVVTVFDITRSRR